MIYFLGSTSQSLDATVVDDNGLKLTSQVAANFPPLFWSLAGPNADVAFPALSDLPLITSPWVVGGIKERAGGKYRIDAPDAMFAALGHITVWGEGSNFHVLVAPIDVETANGGGAGTGANTVTVTVNDGTNPLQNANVRLTSGAQTYLVQTNSLGESAFNLDAGNWTVAITAAGYQFSGGTLTVSGTTNAAYSMTQVAITVISPGFTVGYLTCYDTNGNPLAGVSITATVVQAGSLDTGHVYGSASVTQVSDVNGLVQFTLAKGATYRFTRGTSALAALESIPLNAGSTYALNSFIGAP